MSHCMYQLLSAADQLSYDIVNDASLQQYSLASLLLAISHKCCYLLPVLLSLRNYRLVTDLSHKSDVSDKQVSK